MREKYENKFSWPRRDEGERGTRGRREEEEDDGRDDEDEDEGRDEEDEDVEIEVIVANEDCRVEG